MLFRESEKNGVWRKMFYLIKALAKAAVHPTHARGFLCMMQSKRKTALTALRESDFKGLQQFVEEDIFSVKLTYTEMKRVARSDEFAAFISGSDQIWNGSWFLRNDVYFLKFAPKSKRIAWAPSFGTGTVARYNRRRFARDIGEYRCLSVREQSGVDTVEELTGRQAVRVIDPVLQLTADQWRKYYTAKNGMRRFSKPYIFCYFLNEPGDTTIKHLKSRVDKGMSVVAFASDYERLRKMKNVTFEGGSPWDYLELLDGADEVCSDSFHALAFSLLFHKEMRIFHRNYLYSSDKSRRIISILDQSERITSILKRMNISDRFIDGEKPAEECAPIDFDNIDCVLDSERSAAKKFLKAALEGQRI